jgi:hypothetical protein
MKNVDAIELSVERQDIYAHDFSVSRNEIKERLADLTEPHNYDHFGRIH